MAGVDRATRGSHWARLFCHKGAQLFTISSVLYNCDQNMLLVAGGFSSSSGCATCVCHPSESSRHDFLIVNHHCLDVSSFLQDKISVSLVLNRQTWALPLSSQPAKWKQLADMKRPRNNFHLVQLRSRFVFTRDQG